MSVTTQINVMPTAQLEAIRADVAVANAFDLLAFVPQFYGFYKLKADDPECYEEVIEDLDEATVLKLTEILQTAERSLPEGVSSAWIEKTHDFYERALPLALSAQGITEDKATTLALRFLRAQGVSEHLTDKYSNTWFMRHAEVVWLADHLEGIDSREFMGVFAEQSTYKDTRWYEYLTQQMVNLFACLRHGATHDGVLIYSCG